MELESIGKRVVKRLQDSGYIAYFAGGYVRDLLMKKPSDDIDIATSASTDEVRKLFPKTIPVGVAFGIVIVVEEGHQFEVATFRKDRGYTDGRRPTGIDPATPEEDASRRDFTINGLFLDPIKEIIYDFVGGKEDIERKVVRAIGDPHARFAEDRLRMMRAIRYATRFDFPIEEQTKQAIKKQASSLLPAVAVERIWQEFKKMSQFAHFDEGLILLHELGLLQTIFPSLQPVPSSEIRTRVSYIHRFPAHSPPFAELLELFPNHDYPQIEELATYLKLSNQESAFAKFYTHAQSLFSMPEEWLAKLEPIEWARFYADPHSPISLSMVGAKRSDETPFLEEHRARQKELADPIERIKKKDYYLRAEHLLQEGISPGQTLGALLEEGMSIAVNQKKSTPASILSELKQSPLWPRK